MTKGGLEIAFIISSALSSVVGCFVVLTVVLFPQMRKRLFMKIILCISVCDIIASVASAFGFPNRGSPICGLQGFLIPFFYKASWFWTTFLAYQLYCVVIHSKFGISMQYMHLVTWSLTGLTTLLPLSTNSYGRDDDNDLGWCFISGDPTTAGIWGLLTFNVILLLTTIAIMYFLFRIYWRYRSMNIKVAYPEIYAIIDLLILYPPGFFVTWGPNLIMSVLMNFNGIPKTSNIILIFDSVTILATQSGALVAIIFFMKSKEARFRWAKVIRQLMHPSKLTTEERRSSELSIPQDFQEEDSCEKKIAAELSLRSRSGSAKSQSSSTSSTSFSSPLFTKENESSHLESTSPSSNTSAGALGRSPVPSPFYRSNSEFGDENSPSVDLEPGWHSFVFRSPSVDPGSTSPIHHQIANV